MGIIDTSNVDEIYFDTRELEKYIYLCFLEWKDFETASLLTGETDKKKAYVTKIIALPDFYNSGIFSGANDALVSGQFKFKNYPAVIKKCLDEYGRNEIIGIMHGHYYKKGEFKAPAKIHGYPPECLPSSDDILANLIEINKKIEFGALARVILGKKDNNSVHLFAYRLKNNNITEKVMKLLDECDSESSPTAAQAKYNETLKLLHSRYSAVIERIDVEPQERLISRKPEREYIVT